MTELNWRFLGRVELATATEDLSQSLGKKQIALLGYLAVYGGAVPREEIAEILWPSKEASRSRHNLRQALAAIRKAAGDETDKIIRADREFISLNSDVETDVARLSEAANNDRLSAHDAIDLCRGEFLSGIRTGSPAFDAWLDAARKDAWRRQLSILEAVAHGESQPAPDVIRAIETCRRALEDLPVPDEGNPSAPGRTGGLRRTAGRGRHRNLGWFLGIGLAVCLGLAALAVAMSPNLRAVARDTLLVGSSPARIAVRPFSTINGTAGERNLAGGVTIGVTYALYAITARELFVVTAPAPEIEDDTMSLRQFAGLLDVRYLIEGTVEVDGSDVRVFVRFHDTEAGHDVWQDRFTSTLRDAFMLQDEIVLRILRGLDIDLSSAERNRIQYLDDTGNLEAWLLAADGVRNLIKLEPEHLEAANKAYRRALEIDPTYSSARRGLAWYQLLKVRFGIAESAEAALAEARNHLNIVLRDRPDDGMSKALEGLALLLEGKWDAAVTAGIKATELLPGSADAWAVLAHTYTFTGQNRRALRAIDRAMSLSPGHPPFYNWIRGRALRLLGENMEAIELLSQDSHDSVALVQLVELTAAYASAELFAEARQTAARIKSLHPDFSASTWVLHPAVEDAALQSREFELLSQAGL